MADEKWLEKNYWLLRQENIKLFQANVDIQKQMLKLQRLIYRVAGTEEIPAVEKILEDQQSVVDMAQAILNERQEALDRDRPPGEPSQKQTFQ